MSDTVTPTPPADPKQIADTIGAPAPAPVEAKPTAKTKPISNMDDAIAAQAALVNKGPPTAPDYKPPVLEEFKGKMPEPDPIKAFGSWASVAGVLLGALTRRPLTAALNASAEAMKASRANDVAAYQDAKDTWEKNMKEVTENARLQADAYKMNFEKNRGNWVDTMAGITTLNAMYHTRAVEGREAASAKISQAENTLRLAKAQAEYARNAQRWLDEESDIQSRVNDIARAAGFPSSKDAPKEFVAHARYTAQLAQTREQTAATRTTTGAQQSAEDLHLASVSRARRDNPDYDKVSPERQAEMRATAQTGILAERAGAKVAATADVAKQEWPPEVVTDTAMLSLLTGKDQFGARTPPAVRAEGAKARSRIIGESGLTAAEWAAVPKEKQVDAQALGKLVQYSDGVTRSLGVIDNLFDVAAEYRKKLTFSDIQSINRAWMSGQTEFGSGDANNYANAMSAVALEYGRMLAGATSNAMIPVGIAQQAMGRLNANLSNDQFEGERHQIRREAEGFLKASADQVETRRKSLRSSPGATGVGATRANGAEPAIPPEAIQHLRGNPSLAGEFDEMFGAGAAARVLGKQ